MTTKLILPNHYSSLCIKGNIWMVGRENIKQEYGHSKTRFYPGFNSLLNLVHIKIRTQDCCKHIQPKSARH